MIIEAKGFASLNEPSFTLHNMFHNAFKQLYCTRAYLPCGAYRAGITHFIGLRASADNGGEAQLGRWDTDPTHFVQQVHRFLPLASTPTSLHLPTHLR